MLQEDFTEGVSCYCDRFVCPNCPDYKDSECESDKSGIDCLDKVHDRLNKYKLKRDGFNWVEKEEV